MSKDGHFVKIPKITKLNNKTLNNFVAETKVKSNPEPFTTQPHNLHHNNHLNIIESTRLVLPNTRFLNELLTKIACELLVSCI